MPFDSRGTAVSGPLRNVSLKYRNGQYVADRIFPIIDSVPLKAQIYKYNKGASFRIEAAIRGENAEAAQVSLPTTWVTFAPKEYALSMGVSDERRRLAGEMGSTALQPETEVLEHLADQLDLKREKIVRDKIVETTWVDGNGSGGEDAAGLWAAGASNTFLADIRTGQIAIQKATGLLPNKLLIDFGTYTSLKEESTVAAKLASTERKMWSTGVLASLLDLDEVIVGSAIYSSANEKADGSDFTGVNIWEYNAGKGMGFLFYAPPRPSLYTASAGYQCRENLGGGARRITSWPEPNRHRVMFETAESVDIVVTGTDCGYLWKDTLLT